MSTRVTWKNADLDYDFKNTLPSKLTDNDIYRFDPFSINIQSQNVRLNNVSYPNKKYDIVEKNDETGLVKIKTTFEYLPLGVDLKSNNIQTYSEIKEYKIFNSKQKHELVFIGNSGNDTENIKQIPELKELSESNLLPSSFNSTDPSSILKFINTENSSGYPLSKMIFNIIPNDNDGTITITCSLPDGYYPGEQNKIFKKTYTGLNKITDYSFIVNKQSNSSFNKKQYRPSEIDEQDIYEHFIQYKGFNSSDIKLELSPNDENGELNLKLILDGSYPPSVTTNWGFVKENNQYIKSDSIDGFKTTEEYENQYVVKFKDDNGKSLREIKKYTPNQIKDILKATKINDHKLFIDGVEIKNELDFAKNVIESKGTSIPDNWDNQHFGYEIYYNDTNGEITIKLTFKNIPGTESDLVFIQRYTGFAKGNQVPTEDIFSFKTQAQLFVDNQDFKDLLPSDIESQLKDSENGTTFLNKFIGFSSEAYTNGLNNKKYKLEIVSNDIYGYITLKIIFDSDVVTNKDSLLVYTATYNNFLTE
ncbi:lipoprotein 17-related variable surface protein [Malacoplasma iowae]|uniref:lipoprotein 17-related variable surface protein n=1 Tax=Malacoplasma iowae TaxID=2116 RepID=UPI002A188DB1|nr:lipoprotein 17-related variable surface protein [Malacoplasma iowae]WPL38427.1 lipoprotein 17-related variable surface protein [Malacoplasma iowae]